MAHDGAESGGGVELSAARISTAVYVHDPALPKSARTDSKSTIVITNRNRVRFEKLRTDHQYDYEMKIDVVETHPATWRHAGLPPDGTFAPEYTHGSLDLLRDHYSDYDGLAILAMAACNLVMCVVALSHHDRRPTKIEVEQELSKPLPPGKGLVNFRPPTTSMALWDELDEECMAYALGMLVRLFYRGDGETGERPWREQELRKAVILYLSGTGGTSQFTNFTSLFMSLELAAGFVRSRKIGPDDASHKHAASLLGCTIRRRGTDPAKSDSPLVKSCRKTLGDGMARRVRKYLELNNRLKHYGRDDSDAEYFNSNVKDIQETMRRLRSDAAYVILLGLVKLYGTRPPARASKTSRTSQVILGMIEDCVDRHGAKGADGSVEAKIRRLMDVVENEAVKSEKAIYDSIRSGLSTLEMVARAAGMLCAPDGPERVREMVSEYENVAPDGLKPSKYGLVGEYGEKDLRVWLLHLAHTLVVWMDGQFSAVYVIRHVARYGRESDIKCDPGVF